MNGVQFKFEFTACGCRISTPQMRNLMTDLEIGNCHPVRFYSCHHSDCYLAQVMDVNAYTHWIIWHSTLDSLLQYNFYTVTSHLMDFEFMKKCFCQILHLCCRNHTEEMISNSNGKPFIGYANWRVFIEANDDHHNAESNSRQSVFFVSSSPMNGLPFEFEIT